MSKKQKKRRRETPPATPSAPQVTSSRKWAVLGLLALVGVLIGVGVNRANRQQPRILSDDVTDVNSTNDAEDGIEKEFSGAAKPTVFDSILGKWVRTDGGYVLDLQTVDKNGKLEAAYLNPRPIHIARAAATRERSEIKVFVELQDVNYPGSTYNLTYDFADDQLSGVYYQAVERQSFAVTFTRANQPR